MSVFDLKFRSELLGGVQTAFLVVTNFLICVFSVKFDRIPALCDPAAYQNARKAASAVWGRYKGKPGLTLVQTATVTSGLSTSATKVDILTSYAQVQAVLGLVDDTCESLSDLFCHLQSLCPARPLT